MVGAGRRIARVQWQYCGCNRANRWVQEVITKVVSGTVEKAGAFRCPLPIALVALWRKSHIAMNYKCPCCGEPTISSWEKFKSSGLHPAVSSNCEGHSESDKSENWFDKLFVIVGPFLLVISLIYFRSWWPLVLMVIGYSCYEYHKFRCRPLVKTDREIAKIQHWFVFVILLGVLVWLIWSAFWSIFCPICLSAMLHFMAIWPPRTLPLLAALRL